MEPGREKSNCVLDHSDFFFYVPIIFQYSENKAGSGVHIAQHSTD